jgi:hypothetical protein
VASDANASSDTPQPPAAEVSADAKSVKPETNEEMKSTSISITPSNTFQKDDAETLIDQSMSDDQTREEKALVLLRECMQRGGPHDNDDEYRLARNQSFGESILSYAWRLQNFTRLLTIQHSASLTYQQVIYLAETATTLHMSAFGDNVQEFWRSAKEPPLASKSVPDHTMIDTMGTRDQ